MIELTAWGLIVAFVVIGFVIGVLLTALFHHDG